MRAASKLAFACDYFDYGTRLKDRCEASISWSAEINNAALTATTGWPECSREHRAVDIVIASAIGTQHRDACGAISDHAPRNLRQDRSPVSTWRAVKAAATRLAASQPSTSASRFNRLTSTGFAQRSRCRMMSMASCQVRNCEVTERITGRIALCSPGRLNTAEAHCLLDRRQTGSPSPARARCRGRRKSCRVAPRPLSWCLQYGMGIARAIQRIWRSQLIHALPMSGLAVPPCIPTTISTSSFASPGGDDAAAVWRRRSFIQRRAAPVSTQAD